LPLELLAHQSTSAAPAEYEYDIFTQITRHSTIGQTMALGATHPNDTLVNQSERDRGIPGVVASRVIK